jgi:NADH-quinone oxidoreductase subunit M
VTPGWTATAATGVILGAIYMLWMFRRVILGPLSNPANENLQDLNGRELLLLAPIVLLIIVMGVYPKPFLDRMTASVDLTLKRVFTTEAAAPVYKEAAGGDGDNQEDGR